MDFYRTVTCAACNGTGVQKVKQGYTGESYTCYTERVICCSCNGRGKIRRAGVTPKRPRNSC